MEALAATDGHVMCRILKRTVMEAKGRKNNTIQVLADFKGLGKALNREKGRLESALTRPFRRVLSEGKPTGKINYVLFSEHDLNSPVYVIGSLCMTERGRILFFPGVKDRLTFLHGVQNRELPKNTVMDHITLDADFSCHATFSDGSHFRLSPPIQPVEPDLYGWFSLCIGSLAVLEILPQKLGIEMEVPTSDAERRSMDIMQSREDAVFHVLNLHDDDGPTINDDEFLHIDLYVETVRQEGRRKNLLPSPPKGPPALIEPIEWKLPFTVRSHKVMIPEGWNFNQNGTLSGFSTYSCL